MDFFTIIPYFISKIVDYDLSVFLRVLKLNKITKKIEEILEL